MPPQEIGCIFDYYSSTKLINRPLKNECKVLVFENFKIEKPWSVSNFKNCDKFGLSNLGGIAVCFGRSPTVKNSWWRSLWEDWIRCYSRNMNLNVEMVEDCQELEALSEHQDSNGPKKISIAFFNSPPQEEAAGWHLSESSPAHVSCGASTTKVDLKQKYRHSLQLSAKQDSMEGKTSK